MPSICHYPGNVIEGLLEQSKAGHYFGPDICGAAAPGQLLGRGAFYELDRAEYDPEANRTTAYFKPWIDPRARLRYHGGTDPNAEEPADVGEPTLHTRDRITKR